MDMSRSPISTAAWRRHDTAAQGAPAGLVRRAASRPARTRTAAAIVAALAATMWAPGAAQAETRAFRDPAVDSGQATDLRRVIVKYEHRLRITATYPGDTLEGSVVRYWIDTRRRDPGPEYFVEVRPNSELGDLQRVDTWSTTGGEAVECPSLRAHADIFAEKPRTWLRVGARCLGSPGKVRVAVQTRDGASRDWVESRRTFTAAVHRF